MKAKPNPIRSLLPGSPPLRTMARLPLSPRVERFWLRAEAGPSLCFVLKRASAREYGIYRDWLTAAFAPALAAARPRSGGWLLLLESLPEEFPDLSDPAQVAAVYRHLGMLHSHFLGTRELPLGPWSVCPQRFRQTLQAAGVDRAGARDLAASLAAGPRTLLHGDYHRWNILWHQGRLRALDWEHAGAGHPIWDLALVGPEEPPRESVPGGDLALVALRAYHGAGPLRALPWRDFLRLQTATRLYAAVRRADGYERRAAAVPGGDAARAILAHAQRERERAVWLCGALENGRS